MASVEKYRDADGVRYAARWRHGTRTMKVRRDPRTGQPFASERAAKKYAEEQEADARRGLLPVRSDVTVAEYARYWMTTRRHRESTKQRLRYSLAHFEANGLGRRKLVDVKQSQVQAWASDRAKVLAPSTLRKLVTELGAVFRTAVHDGVIHKSPVVDIRLPEAHKKRMVALTVEQVEALADAMPARYRAMPIVQAGLGLRVGELLGLQVWNVNFLHRKVSIEEQRTRATPGERVELKTASSLRVVPLPRRVAEELARHIPLYSGSEDDLFTTSTGRVPHASHYAGMIAAAARQAGLPKGTTSHSLRHHYATRLLRGRLSTIEVGELLGHTDGSLVEKVYGHSEVDTADRALRALDDDEAV